MAELLCRVESIEALTPLVCAVTLQLDEVIEFEPGQYAQAVMGEQDKRPFSIANAPIADKKIELHIGSHPQNTYANEVLEKMRTGEITLSLPHGNAAYQNPEHRPIILVAGGTGYSYARSILQSFVNADAFPHPVTLYWGAKNLSDLYEYEQLQALAKQYEAFTFVPVVEEPPENWQGKTGWVHKAVLQDHDDLSAYQVYVAGRFEMSKVIRDEFPAVGLAGEHLFGDAFAFI